MMSFPKKSPVATSRAVFWVDGSTAISVQDESTYLWMYATVHAPQLPINSELTLFGQIDVNEDIPETSDEAPQALRFLNDEEAPKPTDIPLSTWTCSVKLNSTPEEKEDLAKDAVWGMSDITG